MDRREPRSEGNEIDRCQESEMAGTSDGGTRKPGVKKTGLKLEVKWNWGVKGEGTSIWISLCLPHHTSKLSFGGVQHVFICGCCIKISQLTVIYNNHFSKFSRVIGTNW